LARAIVRVVSQAAAALRWRATDSDWPPALLTTVN